MHHGQRDTDLPRGQQVYTNKDLENTPRRAQEVYINKDLEDLPPSARKVYTNKDLENLPPLPTERRAAGMAPGATGSSADEASIETAAARVTAASARMEEPEKRLLAIRNPFLPRPALEPEEAQAWEGLDGRERAERVERQLAEARTELAAAEQELARIRWSSEL